MIELSWRVTNSRDSLRLFKYVSSRLNDAYDYGAWDWQCFSKESHLHNQFHNQESELHNHACTDIYDIPT